MMDSSLESDDLNGDLTTPIHIEIPSSSHSRFVHDLEILQFIHLHFKTDEMMEFLGYLGIYDISRFVMLNRV